MWILWITDPSALISGFSLCTRRWTVHAGSVNYTGRIFPSILGLSPQVWKFSTAIWGWVPTFSTGLSTGVRSLTLKLHPTLWICGKNCGVCGCQFGARALILGNYIGESCVELRTPHLSATLRSAITPADARHRHGALYRLSYALALLLNFVS